MTKLNTYSLSEDPVREFLKGASPGRLIKVYEWSLKWAWRAASHSQDSSPSDQIIEEVEKIYHDPLKHQDLYHFIVRANDYSHLKYSCALYKKKYARLTIDQKIKKISIVETRDTNNTFLLEQKDSDLNSLDQSYKGIPIQDIVSEINREIENEPENTGLQPAQSDFYDREYNEVHNWVNLSLELRFM